VAEGIYDEFETRFVAGMRRMKVGDPMQEETDIGPLATGRQLRDIEAQVQAAIKAGGRLLTGGHQLGRVGNYYEPTVITGVPRTAGVFREEVFGPVAMLFRVRDVDEAIEVANDTPFGLGASVWTRDPEEERTFVERLECGGVFVNAMVASDPRLPFGGVKHSGYGRELSAAGMREFLNAKTVVVSEAQRKREEPVQQEPMVTASEAAEASATAAASIPTRPGTTIRLVDRKR
jgi:succinate-semialdehyde dehydrogenase/glutarate-semialdehyde dehydrogenase